MKKSLISLIITTGLLITSNLFSQESTLLSKVRENDINGVKELIAKGADVNMEDDMMGYTPLSLAKNVEMMKVLISGGADINHQDKRTGYTHLMMALNGKNIEVADFLLGAGADFKIKANDGATALILACGISPEMTKRLLEKGANINARTDKGAGVFTQCVIVGLLGEKVPFEFAEFLLSKGAEIDEVNTSEYRGGYTPLFWAVKYNNEEVVSFLVLNGANVNAESKKGETPLSIASESGHNNIVAILKAAGAK